MVGIPSLHFLFKRLGLFLIVFISLSLFSTTDVVKDAHNSFYCGVTNVMFNAINPEIYAVFSTTERTDLRHYGISIALYDEEKYKNRKLSRARLQRVKPDILKFPNLHALVLVPTIFLFSLFIVTPIPVKSVFFKSLIGLLMFYLCLVLYYSYIFALTLNGGIFELNSLWHVIILPFGVDNAELINIFVIMIWAGLSVPQMKVALGAK